MSDFETTAGVTDAPENLSNSLSESLGAFDAGSANDTGVTEAADDTGPSVEEGGESKTARRIREHNEAVLGLPNRFNHASSDPKNTPQARASAASRERLQDMAAATIRNLPGADREIDLNLGGRAAKVKIGDLHIATRRALAKQQEKIKQMQHNGASAQDLALAQQQLNELQRLNDLTSPPFDQTDAELEEIKTLTHSQKENNPIFQAELVPFMKGEEQSAINDLASEQGLAADKTLDSDVYALAGGAGDDPYGAADGAADPYGDPYADPAPLAATQASSFAKSLDDDGAIESDSGPLDLAQIFAAASSPEALAPDLVQDRAQPAMAQTLKL